MCKETLCLGVAVAQHCYFLQRTHLEQILMVSSHHTPAATHVCPCLQYNLTGMLPHLDTVIEAALPKEWTFEQGKPGYVLK
jgi:hypothetical protein